MEIEKYGDGDELKIMNFNQEESSNKNNIEATGLKFMTTEVLQFLSNDDNNNFYDKISVDLYKKQKFLIKNLSTFQSLNSMIDNKNFGGMPGDFEKEQIKVRKFFIENQASYYECRNDKKNSVKLHLIQNNLKKINKYINLLNMLNSKDFGAKMKNNVDLYKYIINHPYLKVLDKEILNQLLSKYSQVGIEIIKIQMKNNTTYKHTEGNIESSNLLQEEENEDDDYNEDDEYYESGDEIV